MGQPIYLIKDGEKLTVYGLAQASVMLAQGWVTDIDGEQSLVSPDAYKADDLTKINGVGDVTAAFLAEHGFTTYVKIANANLDDLVAPGKISKNAAKNIKAEAAKLV